jgi:hypothetical protein
MRSIALHYPGRLLQTRPSAPSRFADSSRKERRMDSRREFLKKAGAAAVGAAVGPGLVHAQPAPGPTPGDGPGTDLLMTALQVARDGGASYADARLGRYRRQMVGTRERRVETVSDNESYGLGVRVLVGGSWGFAATRDLSRDAVQQAAWISKLTGVTRSHGCAFADSWSSVTFQRMPNVSLLPGDQALGLDDLIAATERGIVVKNRGSWSIDQQRYNFQFSGPSTRSAAVRWSAY